MNKHGEGELYFDVKNNGDVMRPDAKLSFEWKRMTLLWRFIGIFEKPGRRRGLIERTPWVVLLPKHYPKTTQALPQDYPKYYSR